MSLSWFTYNLQNDLGVDELLSDLGHFLNTSDRSEAIASYQDYSGLKQTGTWTSAESDRLFERNCTCPDISRSSSNKGHWEFGENEKQIINLWSNVRGANDRFVANWMAGFKWWKQNNINLDFEFVESQRDCHVWATYQFIDGRNRTLAWSMLPVRHQRYRSRFLEQRYDPADMNSDARSQRVSAHEAGHALGLDHIPSSVGVNLMNPFDNASILGLMPGDTAEAVERYGVIEASPVPDPDPEVTLCDAQATALRSAKKKLDSAFNIFEAAEDEYQKALAEIENQV